MAQYKIYSIQLNFFSVNIRFLPVNINKFRVFGLNEKVSYFDYFFVILLGIENKNPMSVDFDHDVIEEQDVGADVETVRQRSLLLYNDDFNTFDFVIESLMEICDHDMIQAEQSAWIVHNNGKCSVKMGSYKDLNPLRVALCDRGLSAVID